MSASRYFLPSGLSALIQVNSLQDVVGYLNAVVSCVQIVKSCFLSQPGALHMIPL